MIIHISYRLLEAETCSPKMDCGLSHMDTIHGRLRWMLSILDTLSNIEDVPLFFSRILRIHRNQVSGKPQKNLAYQLCLVL